MDSFCFEGRFPSSYNRKKKKFCVGSTLRSINTKLRLSFLPNSPIINDKDSYIVNDEQVCESFQRENLSSAYLST